MVGTGRFELPTPRTPSECSTRLSHVPTQRSRLLASRLFGVLISLHQSGQERPERAQMVDTGSFARWVRICLVVREELRPLFSGASPAQNFCADLHASSAGRVPSKPGPHEVNIGPKPAQFDEVDPARTSQQAANTRRRLVLSPQGLAGHFQKFQAQVLVFR
jgi:hypothetical protein